MSQASAGERLAAPVELAIMVKTNREAELLVNALIGLERSLRMEWITKGIPRDIGLADRLAVSRRLLQEEAGLVMTLKLRNETEAD